VVALNKDIVKRWHKLLDLQKCLGTRRTFLFIQDGLGASLNPCVEQDEVLFQVRYCFGGYWDGLRLDALISVELNPSQSPVSGDILILLPDGLVQAFYLNFTRLLRQSFCGRFDSLIGVKGVEQPDS
jgi:hypothetical protein